MKSNDINSIKTRDALREQLQQNIKDGDSEAFAKTFDELVQRIGADVEETVTQRLEEARQEADSRILATRGVHQLTSTELNYYQKLASAMRSNDPKQAVSNLDVVMPETVVDSVFEDLRTEHPLLSLLDFQNTGGAVRMMMNTNGYQEAAWGKLCAEIVTELTGGFKEVDSTLFKLSAFLPVCKAMLDLGPQWLDRFVREVLYEALANGLEAGLVDGTGKEMPIGMTRQVGDSVTVTAGVYPRKEAVKLSRLDPVSIGNLLSLLAVTEKGTRRRVQNVIFVCNPQDYLQKVMPATTLMAPDGSYRNDVMPYPMTIVQSPALNRGEAVIGLGKQYFAAAGMAKDGRIEYSDDYHFLEDERVYLIKTYANGFPKDNNAFLLLDISGLQPAVWRVQAEDLPYPSNDATLSALTLGSLSLSPAFDSATTTYTASTTNATNTITAVPGDSKATVTVAVNGTEIDNGSAATWAAGSNTVLITVTAEDGETTGTYTVTVTKS